MRFAAKGFLLLTVLMPMLIYPAQSLCQIKGAHGLTISPPISELTIAPGKTESKTIKLTNPTANLVEVYPQAMNFRAKGEEGEPGFYPASEESSNFALSNWLTFLPAKIVLTPQQVSEFDYQIKVPQSAEPGGHYGVIFFASTPPKPDQNLTQVAIASMVGSLILVKVPGKIIEKGQIIEFSAKRFYFKPPVDFITRIANSGNVHFKPIGNIAIKGMSGKELASSDLNATKGNVLPESIRKFDNRWDASKWTFGRLSAALTATYSESGQKLTANFNFWIIPWWFIAAISLLIIIIIIIIIVIIRKKKKAKMANVGISSSGSDSRSNTPSASSMA